MQQIVWMNGAGELIKSECLSTFPYNGDWCHVVEYADRLRVVYPHEVYVYPNELANGD